jgi:hypothetical protein
MTRYIALRDRRLEGGVPARAGLTIVNATASTPLSSLFGQINGALGARGRFHSMFILCHGYAGRNARQRVSMDAGGEGLQIGAEGVLHTNVSRWTAIAGKVDNIVVYSCAAGNTERGNEGTTADGRYLMGALAIHTGATVYAADRIQWYGTYNDLANGRYEFGEWEGNLWQFPPNGNPPTIVAGAPVEFADVMGGSAP